jgi:pyruvate dehydrogenase E2 component (dihydrolipoamide acetyltransferase)
MTTFNLPDLGEGLAEAEIVRWHVNVGDAVTVDQPMLAVETAKAVVEVPAPFSGVVKTLHGQPGDIVATGAPLIEFEASSRTRTIDSGTVVGNVPTSDDELIETAHPGRATNGVNGANGTDGANGAAAASRTHGPNGGSTQSPNGGHLRAAPAARALAKKLGVDLAQLNGTGPGGVIIVDDVIAHSNTTQLPTAPGQGTTGAKLAPVTPRPTPTFSGGEQLRGLRRAMSQSMALARDNIATCTIFDDADLHHWREGEDFTTRLLRAIAAGCEAEPALNAWFDGATQTRRLMPRVDIGMAVDTGEGLIVPVIRDVSSRNAKELRQEIDRLKRAARDRTVTPDDLRDVTIMLSNFGMIAGRYATPIVVPPMVAILGSGRLSRDVIAVNDRIEAHLRMPLSLTFDHRCVTGGEAARFLAAVLRDLEKDN